MGFFKWLDKHIRASNASDFAGYGDYSKRRDAEIAAEKEQREAEEAAEKTRMKNLECCANCTWFVELHGRCSKHDCSFSPYDMAHNNHYLYYCVDFWRK